MDNLYITLVCMPADIYANCIHALYGTMQWERFMSIYYCAAFDQQICIQSN